MNLTTKWRRPRRRREGDEDEDDPFYLPTRDNLRPIDTQEQEEMVKSFEKKHAQQSLLWRGVFGAFLLCYVGFLVYSIIHQAVNPWELQYHAYFMEDVKSWLVILADMVAAIACLLAVKGLLHSSSAYKQWFWYSCYTSLFLATFWLYHMMGLPRFRWDIIWLPFGPLRFYSANIWSITFAILVFASIGFIIIFGAGICLYVDHLLEESADDIKKLRNSMYYFKVK